MADSRFPELPILGGGARAGLGPATLAESVGDVVRGNRQAAGMPTLSYMELILTDQCNLRCDYCFEADKNSHVMSDETAFGSVDFLMDASRQVENLTILFFGGEPLLRFDLLQRVLTYANAEAASRGKRVHYDMTTNGTLMTEDKARWLRDHKVKYLLSIDGVGQDHDRYRHFANGRGSFDLVAERLPLMKRYQPWLGAKMTLTPEGCAGLAENISTLHRMGVNQFVLGYGHGMPWSVDDLAAYEQALLEVCELYLEMKYKGRYFRMTLFEEGEPGKAAAHQTFGCGAGRGRFCVDSYGDVYGCSKLATITGMRNGVLPFGNIIQGHTRVQNRAEFLVTEVGPREKCRECEYNDVCGGGCPAVNYAANSNIYDPDDLSCRIVFVNQRVHEYMRRRHREVFGDEVSEDPGKAEERKADAVCVDI